METSVTETRPFWRRRRYLVVLLSFFGFINIYTLRINLSIAIVSMTESRKIFGEDGSVLFEKDFDWNSKEIGLVLSSFFFGYITTQIIGGYIASKIGGNIVFGFGIGTTAILTLLTPTAAKLHLYALVFLRVVMGFCEGVAFPAMHQIYSEWAPVPERSRIVMFVFCGNYLGMVIAMSGCGVLAESYGWESVFYCFGVIGCIWMVLWFIFVRASPEEDRFISEEEKTYIRNNLENKDHDKSQMVPWKSIFTSMPVWAIIVSQVAENWGLYTLLTQLPLFLKDVFQYDLEKSGFISAAPYLVFGILLLLSGYLADWSQLKGYLTRTQVRRYFNCFAFLAQTIFMVIAAYLMHPIWTVVMLIAAAAFGAFSLSGYAVNHLDIAPQYASILMGISNTFASLPGVISPQLTGFIVTEAKKEEWRIVLYLAAFIYFIGALTYWSFASGEIQPWAKNQNDNLELNTQETDESKRR